jgi:hypothetical protein
MGNVIAKLHHHEWRQPNALCGTRLIVEDCESVHLHLRNIRLEFTREEFQQFASAMAKAANSLSAIISEPNEQHYHVLAEDTVSHLPKYSPATIRLELNPGVVHIHSRNLRLEYTLEEYLEYYECEFFGHHNLVRTDREMRYIPLTEIDALDICHRLPFNPEEANLYPLGVVCHDHEWHVQRINDLLADISAGKLIRPIAVKPAAHSGDIKYKRMDGFCRYWAHKLAGKDHIECVISPFAFPGCQNDCNPVLSPLDYQKLSSGYWIF